MATTLSLSGGDPVAQVHKFTLPKVNRPPKLGKLMRTIYVSSTSRSQVPVRKDKRKGKKSRKQEILPALLPSRFKDYYVQSADETIMPIPQHSYFNLYIAGPSGSGKSSFIASWLKHCHDKWPKCKIYIFSPKDDDPAFAKIKPEPIYCKVDKDIVEEPMSIDEFEGTKSAPSIIIFDDIEALDHGPISKAIETFQNQCLETGRKSHISTISVSHVLLNGLRTRKVINESRYITVFPGSNFSQIESYVKRYLGFGKEDVDFLKRVPSRWVMMHRDYPRYLVYETGVHLL